MIVALMTYQNPDDGRGDLPQALSLARLLTDLEPEFRPDTLLVLSYQPGTPRTPLVEKTVAHCRRRFPVLEVVSEEGARGHPEGCTALWRGTISHLRELARRPVDRPYHPAYDDESDHGNSFLTLDAGDGIPLHRNWLDLMIGEHVQTLRSKKLITGTPYFLGECPLHLNPNSVFNVELFDECPQLLDPVPYDGTVHTNFDVYHREAMLPRARLTSAVRTDWRGDGRAATPELLLERSREAIWLHGYRDERIYWMAREHVALDPRPPLVREYDLNQLRVHEIVRRSYEEAGRTEASR